MTKKELAANTVASVVYSIIKESSPKHVSKKFKQDFQQNLKMLNSSDSNSKILEIVRQHDANNQRQKKDAASVSSGSEDELSKKIETRTLAAFTEMPPDVGKTKSSVNDRSRAKEHQSQPARSSAGHFETPDSHEILISQKIRQEGDTSSQGLIESECSNPSQDLRKKKKRKETEAASTGDDSNASEEPCQEKMCRGLYPKEAWLSSQQPTYVQEPVADDTQDNGTKRNKKKKKQSERESSQETDINSSQIRDSTDQALDTDDGRKKRKSRSSSQESNSSFMARVQQEEESSSQERKKKKKRKDPADVTAPINLGEETCLSEVDLLQDNVTKRRKKKRETSEESATNSQQSEIVDSEIDPTDNGGKKKRKRSVDEMAVQESESNPNREKKKKKKDKKRRKETEEVTAKTIGDDVMRFGPMRESWSGAKRKDAGGNRLNQTLPAWPSRRKGGGGTFVTPVLNRITFNE